ncbi:FtsH protease activity modulator HflK [Robiginitomaculum antarcticum]|uniref:FtsH protease activity modulator HflK n=1 Tax=Robiginitomaculum antarcticum TaxID=437507 RepID=UPI00035FCF2C|nr:FtsH protease activity modulator HflK [Robiginitomaculum antarcticum]
MNDKIEGDLNNGSPWGSGSGGNGGGKKPGGPWGNGNGGPRPVRPVKPRANPGPQDFEKAVEQLKSRFGGGRKGGPNGPGGAKSGKGIPLPLLVLGALGFFLVVTSVYKVDVGEEAVILRFGQYSRTTAPGLHVKMPTPLEIKELVDVERERSVDIGTSSENLMLTGDEKIARVAYSVRWRVGDSADYVFNVADVPSAVQDVAESAMREVVGKTTLEDLSTSGRDIVAQRVQVLMQEMLDDYQAGVIVSQVELKEAQEPRAVEQAFLDVVDAKQDAEQSILKAKAVENTVIPQSKAQGDQLIQEARGYKEAVIADAKGNAARFDSVYQEYRRAPRVTRQRIYLETMEEVYKGKPKIIIDGNAGSGVVPYLPLDQIKKTNN